ncbi:hypothetical protein V500_11223 [Pseudogymnoascus sp. VKM F-4518 (FW-2643)]|nr:hypothetical protein V500_11223 [Pseudogymnoascus sp. VKM F-4518 (FW-2643)]
MSDSNALSAAMAQYSVVLSLLGPSIDDRNIDTTALAGIYKSSVFPLMHQHGVRRIFAMGTLSIKRPEDRWSFFHFIILIFMRLFASAIYRCIHNVAQAFEEEASGIDWTIFRIAQIPGESDEASWKKDRELGELFTGWVGEEGWSSSVARSGLARWLADAAEGGADRWVGKMPAISCPSKPEWMDGGERQREMAERVKAEVKRSAKRRRGEKHIQNIMENMSDTESCTIPQLHEAPSPSNSSAPFHISCSTPFQATRGMASAREPGSDTTLRESAVVSPSSHNSAVISNTSSGATTFTTNRAPQESRNHSIAQNVQLSPLPQRSEEELSFVMAYLDYVFPVLFPFYKPPILEGGRSWLLVQIMKNTGLFHTVISLVSYFFSVVPIIVEPARELCVHADLLESAYLLESIVQLLNVEVVISRTENWQVHLEAAIVLFKQIFQYHGMNQSSSDISHILAQMGHGSFITTPSNSSLWNADQAAFRFFSAILLVDDIVSSTSLESAPRLHEYHPHLLSNDLSPEEGAPLQLENFVGCQNWVLVLVGEIAALDRWKKDMRKGGTLLMAQLVQRASVIQQQLDDGLARLKLSQGKQQQESHEHPRPIDVLTQYGLHGHKPNMLDDCTSITRIWAYAARTYLLIVVSGWQPANLEIRSGVARTIELFSHLASHGWLRTLAWPLCVTECLAEESQEPIIRELVSSMGALQKFGTMHEALMIMENAWRCRRQIDVNSWDIAACFRSLGYTALLV